MVFAIGSSGHSVPRRMIIFVDGENLTCRYQELKNVRQPFSTGEPLQHSKDVYVWKYEFADLAKFGNHQIIKATYYASYQGDDDQGDKLRAAIKQDLHFPAYGTNGRLTTFSAQIFKRKRGSRKEKLVDLQIAIDVLHHVYHDTVDTVFLFTGDADYLPLINEIQRSGKIVYLAAFSSGLNEKLKHTVDKFSLLDSFAFEQK